MVAQGFLGGSLGKEPAYQCRRRKRRRFDPQVGKISWRRAWKPTLVFLPGESHGKKSLAGQSPQGRKESDMTEATEHTCTMAVHLVNMLKFIKFYTLKWCILWYIVTKLHTTQQASKLRQGAGARKNYFIQKISKPKRWLIDVSKNHLNSW